MTAANRTAMKRKKSNSLQRPAASVCRTQSPRRLASSPANGFGLVAAGAEGDKGARRLLNFDPASLLTKSK
jgi:hypothetical protein